MNSNRTCSRIRPWRNERRFAYSRDGGHTWTTPQYKTFADGRRMKHPRAANFVWKCENGKYLYWFHHHGGRFIGEHPQRPNIAYEDRNPVWLCGGVEADSPEGKVIRWSQPDLLDGGDARQFGWGRFNPHFRGPSGDATLQIGPSIQGAIESVRVYRRALRTSEAIGNYSALSHP